MSAPTTAPDTQGSPAKDRPATHRRRSWWSWLGGVLVLVMTAAAGSWYLQREPVIFPEGRAFHDEIVDEPRLDLTSADVAALLADPDGRPTMNLNSYANPIYTADASTPRHDLTILRKGPDDGQWGDNELAHQPVPIPKDVEVSSGSDGKIVVIDPETDQVFDIWRAQKVGGQWQAEWGGVYPLGGDGSSHRSAYGEGRYHVPWPEPVSRGTGSGISSLAGVIRVEELAQGEIPHALAFSTNRSCGPANSGPYRWPATTTDGWVVSEPCIPQGGRIQLDPSLDLDAVSGLTRVERIIGKALQDYGAYAIDIGGARMAFATEAARSAEDRTVFAELNLADDFHMLEELPAHYRMLARWDGS